jgi:hypothetical protein
VERCWQVSSAANELTLRERWELVDLGDQDQREIKRLQNLFRKKERTLAEPAALLLVTKRSRHFGERP